jgi:hypothetical protein
MTAESRATVVVLAGGVASGKTTLIASLYERFAHGPIAGRRFAGSQTLPGFEARAQGLRPLLGAAQSMPHTHRNAVPWLHVRVALASEQPQDLLLGDFDGEVFDRVIEGKDAPDSVPALRRADHVAVVLDGQALVEASRRSHARQRSVDLIEVLAQERVLAASSVLSLVVTKLDLLNRAPRDARVAARGVVAELRTRLIERAAVREPAVIETAAISSVPDLPLGHGLDELLDHWHRRPATVVGPSEAPEVPHAYGQWFGRFAS